MSETAQEESIVKFCSKSQMVFRHTFGPLGGMHFRRTAQLVHSEYCMNIVYILMSTGR